MVLSTSIWPAYSLLLIWVVTGGVALEFWFLNGVSYSYTWSTGLGRHLLFDHLSSQGCTSGICKTKIVVGWCFWLVRVLLTGDLVAGEITQ